VDGRLIAFGALGQEDEDIRFAVGGLIAASCAMALPTAVFGQTAFLDGRAVGWSQPGPAQRAELCDAQHTPLMILGTYHMSNPGLDAINVEADDVLSPQRQAELARVVESLLRFKPTKVAVEWPYKEQAKLTTRFDAYQSGNYQLSHNEIDQLGLRIARAAGLKTVDAVDYPMFMSGLTPMELVNEPSTPPPAVMPRGPATSPRPAETPRRLSPEEQLLRRSTVASYLVHINSDTSVSGNAATYPGMLLPDTASPALYARADLVANWYKRNLRIFANLTRATQLPSDRVLLIIGTGHVHILSDLALTSRYYCLVSPLEHLTAAH
jgi:hypothetical protein